MIEHAYAVIMAGGGGTRLWPLSRQAKPKQMLRLGDERTLFQLAIERLNGLFPVDHIYVVTVAEQAAELQQQCPQIPTGNFLVEPMPRGTASVVGLAALVLRARDPLASMVVLTADHIIRNIVDFQKDLKAALAVAEDGYLVTLGISPTFPAVGYGYIQVGQAVETGSRALAGLRFKEKPDEATARKFIEQGDHVWNSGMFIWKVSRIWEDFQRYMPDLFTALEKIDAFWGQPDSVQRLAEIWSGIRPQTIDYGIMEVSDRVAVIRADKLGWNDVGSWESLFIVLPADENGNIILNARHLGMGTTDSLICSDQPERLIVTVGMTNLIVVDTGDALLICSREDSQKIREVVALLNQKQLARYL